MKTKKWISLILTGVLTAGVLAGCGSTGSNGQSSDTSAAEESSQETASTGTQEEETREESETVATETPEAAITEEAEAADTEDMGKTLVVYYSASGNTARVAQDIADASGADLFELVPEEPYTDEDLDYTDENSRVSREHDDESLRDVKLAETNVDNWESYDTVLIGYPIWWAIAAWPVNDFVKSNDFTGKTVIPFCTAFSSDIGESGELLAELAGTGDWQEGKRFSSSADADEVQAWVAEIGLAKS